VSPTPTHVAGLCLGLRVGPFYGRKDEISHVKKTCGISDMCMIELARGSSKFEAHLKRINLNGSKVNPLTPIRPNFVLFLDLSYARFPSEDSDFTPSFFRCYGYHEI